MALALARRLLALTLCLLVAGAGAYSWAPRLASAQGAVALDWLQVALWPEYDDPRLLVILDGELLQPGLPVQAPVPAGATLHAVASAREDGVLLDTAYQISAATDGSQIVTLTPFGALWRVEYYTPLMVSGEGRVLQFSLPANFFTINRARIEVLLPPGAAAASGQPALTSLGATATGAPILERQLGAVPAGQDIAQSVNYSNPSGALAVPEDAREDAPGVQAPAVSPGAQPAATTAAAPAQNIPLLLLGAAATALIAVGGYGLWRTRAERAGAKEARRREGRWAVGGEPRTSARTGRDLFCRQCGTGFEADDRFCRKCGAERR